MYERVLAVRDAMLRTLTTLEPAVQAEAGQTQLAAAAAQGLARALEALPTEEEMEDAAPRGPAEGEPGTSAGGKALASAAASQGADSVDSRAASSFAVQVTDAAEPPEQQGQQSTAQQQQQDQQQQQQGQPAGLDVPQLPGGPPQTVLGDAHRTGTAGALDGGALRGVQLIPAPDNQAVRARIAQMGGPDDLVGAGGRGRWGQADWVRCVGGVGV